MKYVLWGQEIVIKNSSQCCSTCKCEFIETTIIYRPL